jgi:hypothetical protein
MSIKIGYDIPTCQVGNIVALSAFYIWKTNPFSSKMEIIKETKEIVRDIELKMIYNSELKEKKAKEIIYNFEEYLNRSSNFK